MHANSISVMKNILFPLIKHVEVNVKDILWWRRDFQKLNNLQITIGNNNRYSHGIYRKYPSAPEISIYLYTFRSLYGNCIGMHKLLPFSKFMRFPTLFYNV